MNYNKEKVDELKHLFVSKPHSYFNLLKHNDKYKYLYDWINSVTVKLQDPFYNLTTKLYWIFNDIIDFPKCTYCGKPLVNKNVNQINDPKYFCCSTACGIKERTKFEKAKITKKLIYGDENYNNVLKRRKTKFKRYGSETYCNQKQANETKYKKYGHDMFDHEKYKKTNIERYGVDNVMRLEEWREKARSTISKKYGVDNFSKIQGYGDMIKKIKKERYGNPVYTNANKRIQTNIRKYGFPSPMMNRNV